MSFIVSVNDNKMVLLKYLSLNKSIPFKASTSIPVHSKSRPTP